MGKSYGVLAKELEKFGRDGDTMLAHINPAEAEMLKLFGGAGTINPDTGLREYRYGPGASNEGKGSPGSGPGEGGGHGRGTGGETGRERGIRESAQLSTGTGHMSGTRGIDQERADRVNRANEMERGFFGGLFGTTDIADDGTVSREAFGFDPMGLASSMLGPVGMLGYEAATRMGFEDPSRVSFAADLGPQTGTPTDGPDFGEGPDRGGRETPITSPNYLLASGGGTGVPAVDPTVPDPVLSPWDYQQQKWDGNNFLLAPLTRTV